MKHILKIVIIFALSFSSKMKAQLDTLNYLKTFEANKANYIGKPLSFLLDNMMEIQPKTIWKVPLHGIRRYVSESVFSYNEKSPFINGNVIFFTIIWKERIPYSDVEYYEKKNHFLFTVEERRFYGNKVIKDIKINQ
ncbi:hypothetical protein [Chryseobacterium sp.]|jgi:hypothetical protein|uniref:hypothetical protein n=1 Tax=Chryseobacterium sp. TaxID=1871047 RepID=UPI00283E3B25|nr:hypothetical protein [Chryseobacterium sp.]MDR3023874.1 hypothetical protein [Chryseobacterium sp.]